MRTPLPYVSSREEKGEAGIDESTPTISSEPSCEEDTAVGSSELSREETEADDECAPVVSSDLVQEGAASGDGACSEPVQEGTANS